MHHLPRAIPTCQYVRPPPAARSWLAVHQPGPGEPIPAHRHNVVRSDPADIAVVAVNGLFRHAIAGCTATATPSHDNQTGSAPRHTGTGRNPWCCPARWPQPGQPTTFTQLLGRFLMTVVPVAVFSSTVAPGSLKIPPPSVTAIFFLIVLLYRASAPSASL